MDEYIATQALCISSHQIGVEWRPRNGGLIMKSFSPLARLAELDLEEAIIREGYMANVRGMFARLIAERLCEIYEEREFITASMVQEQALRAQENLPSE